MISFTTLLLYTREKNPRNPLDRRLGQLQCQCGRGGEKKIPAPAGIRFPVVKPIAYSLH
jgi:hypothetical protein